jgi:CelD/BcsL family acetyltransferase involved in cellulose biosynthesis
VLWRELDSQWRYGVGRARREGVLCELTADAQDIADFFSLCGDVSRAKGFQLPGSAELIEHLLQGFHSEAVSAHLMVARAQSGLAAGACVLRCGSSAHYFWGASDRGFSKYRAGEAVQWAVIEWALAQGCSLYDLEGIDPVKNPGVYNFKKKMGGVDVTLEGMMYRPLGWRGVLLDGARRLLNR